MPWTVVVAPEVTVTVCGAGVAKPLRPPKDTVWVPGAIFIHVKPHSSLGTPSTTIFPLTAGLVVTRRRPATETVTNAALAAVPPFPSFTLRTTSYVPSAAYACVPVIVPPKKPVCPLCVAPSPNVHVYETLSPFTSFDVEENVTSCPGIEAGGDVVRAVKVGALFAATEVVTVVKVDLAVWPGGGWSVIVSFAFAVPAVLY